MQKENDTGFSTRREAVLSPFVEIVPIMREATILSQGSVLMTSVRGLPQHTPAVQPGCTSRVRMHRAEHANETWPKLLRTQLSVQMVMTNFHDIVFVLFFSFFVTERGWKQMR